MEVRAGEARTAEVRPGKGGTGKIRAAEIRVTEIDADEGRVGKFRGGEIWTDLWSLMPPGIPHFDTLLKKRQMLRVGHGDIILPRRFLGSGQDARISQTAVYQFATEQPLDLDKLRARLRGMEDDALARFGRAGAYLCTPEANHGKPPRQAFVTQLLEARAEWRRRRGSLPLGERP